MAFQVIVLIWCVCSVCTLVSNASRMSHDVMDTAWHGHFAASLSRALLGGTYSFVLSILEHILTRFAASSAHHQRPQRVLMFPICVRRRWEMFRWSSPMVSSPPQAQSSGARLVRSRVCQMVGMGLGDA